MRVSTKGTKGGCSLQQILGVPAHWRAEIRRSLHLHLQSIVAQMRVGFQYRRANGGLGVPLLTAEMRIVR